MKQDWYLSQSGKTPANELPLERAQYGSSFICAIPAHKTITVSTPQLSFCDKHTELRKCDNRLAAGLSALSMAARANSDDARSGQGRRANSNTSSSGWHFLVGTCTQAYANNRAFGARVLATTIFLLEHHNSQKTQNTSNFARHRLRRSSSDRAMKKSATKDTKKMFKKYRNRARDEKYAYVFVRTNDGAAHTTFAQTFASLALLCRLATSFFETSMHSAEGEKREEARRKDNAEWSLRGSEGEPSTKELAKRTRKTQKESQNSAGSGAMPDFIRNADECVRALQTATLQATDPPLDVYEGILRLIAEFVP